MALVAAAVCPHPPLLLPAIGTGIDLASRAAARTAVSRLAAAEPDLVVVVGPDRQLSTYGPTDSGSLGGFGVDARIPLGPQLSAAPPVLPLSLTVGAWLLGEAGWTGECRGQGVPEDLPAGDAAALGARLAALAARVAVLAMGDGAARRSEKAPGWFDARAEEVDATVAAALSQADLETLLQLDEHLARELLAVGRATWQVLAGAAAGSDWSAELLSVEAPFGVGYFVASWDPSRSAPSDVGAR